MKVLITAVGGMTSREIIMALREWDNIEIYGVDTFEYAIGRCFVDRFAVVSESRSDKRQFVEQIAQCCVKWGINVVVPCSIEDNLALAKYRYIVKSRGVSVMVNAYSDLVLTYDKGMVYEMLSYHMREHAPKYCIVGTRVEFLKAIEQLGYPRKPLIIKPRYDRGGGVYRLDNSQDAFGQKFGMSVLLQFFTQSEVFDEEFIVMESLSEPFYSVYSLCDNGRNLISITHIREWDSISRRYRELAGYDATCEAIANRVIEHYHLGYTNNMEFATSEDGRIVLFDLKAHLGAFSGINKDIGLNFPLLAMKMALGGKVGVIDKNRFKTQRPLIRYFDQVRNGDNTQSNTKAATPITARKTTKCLKALRIMVECVGSLTSGYLIRAIQDAGHIAVGSDISAESYGASICDEFVYMPSVKDKELWEKIESILLEHRIDMVIPSFDEMLLGWAKRKGRYANLGVCVVVSPVESVVSCVDKYAMYEKCQILGIDTPKTRIYTRLGLIKPRYGRGGKGVVVGERQSGYITQEVIKGREWTVDCLFDNRGRVVYIIPRVRIGVRDGKSTGGEVVKHEKIESIVRKMADNLVFVGAINFQFIESEKRLVLLEINPRIAGGMALGIASSENWLGAIVDNFYYDEPLYAKHVRYGMKMYRGYDERYC